GCEGWTQESVWTAASRLRNHPAVKKWLAISRTEVVKEIGHSKEQAIQDLEDIKQRALAEGKYIAAINAEQLQCKILGHIGDQKHDDRVKDSPQSVLSLIEKKFGPEMARAASKQ